MQLIVRGCSLEETGEIVDVERERQVYSYCKRNCGVGEEARGDAKVGDISCVVRVEVDGRENS